LDREAERRRLLDRDAERLLEALRLAAPRRFLDLDFDLRLLLEALGVLDLRVDLLREAFGVLERRLAARRFFDLLGFSSPSTAALGALGVLAFRRLTERLLLAFGVLDLRAERLLEALGVLDLRLVARRFLDLLGFSSPSAAAFGALGVLALRRLTDRLLLALGVLDLRADRFLEAFGVLERRFAARRFLDLFGFSSPSTAALGALGVLALRRLAERLLLAFGVLDLRLAERDLDAFGVLLLRLLDDLRLRRFGLEADFMSTSESSATFLGALGVRARRRLAERLLLLLALGVLDLRFEADLEAVLDREDLGVLERRLARRFLDLLGFVTSPSTSMASTLGALGVRARRRLEDRLLLALGVLDLRLEADLDLDDLGVLERRFAARRFLDRLGFSSPSTAALGALGVRALRRLTERLLLALGVLERRLADLDLDDLGVLERRLAARRFLDLLGFSSPSAVALGALGVRARRRLTERLLLAFGVLDLRFEAERDTDRDLEARGVLERLLEARRRLADRDLEELGSLDFGALGVLARRLDARRFLDLLGFSSPSAVVFFGALGALARLLEALRFLEALGVLLLRLRPARREVFVLGPLGVRARRRLTERLLLTLGVLLLRVDFLRDLLGALGLAGPSPLAFLASRVFLLPERARFFLPRSLFLFASMSVLY